MATNNTSVSTLKQQIHDDILQDIINGFYQLNQLINEKGLIERFAVSRAPIREALVELCNEGVLYSIPYYGYKISPLTVEDIRKIQEYRIVLECGFLYTHYDRIANADLSCLEELIAKEYTKDKEFDALTHWNQNIDFHLALFSFHGNTHALDSLKRTMTIQTRAYALRCWEKWHTPLFKDVSNFHELILDSIKNNDMLRAVNLLKADIQDI